MKKWIYISLSALIAVLAGVLLANVSVGAKLYYNVEAIPKAYIRESDLSSFLIPSNTETYEEIYVNYVISYDDGDEISGDTLYCFYRWQSGDLKYVKITTNSGGTNIVQYWQDIGAMGRLYYNGTYLNTAAGELQDYTMFLAIDDENARQNRLFYFYFFEDIAYQDGYDSGLQVGYNNGTAAGIAAVQAAPSNYGLYSQNEYNAAYQVGYSAGHSAGIIQGVLDVQAAPSDYNLYTQAQYDQAYQDGMNAVNIPSFIRSLLAGIAAFLNIKIGSVSIGAILLIPFSISMVWFVIRQFRGGGGN